MLRVSKECETVGLDIYKHDEEAYPECMKNCRKTFLENNINCWLGFFSFTVTDPIRYEQIVRAATTKGAGSGSLLAAGPPPTMVAPLEPVAENRREQVFRYHSLVCKHWGK